MSIYPVRLSEWFPKSNNKEESIQHDHMKMMVRYNSCIKCNRKKIDWRYAYGHHSLPWGYGDVWCTRRCYKGNSK